MRILVSMVQVFNITPIFISINARWLYAGVTTILSKHGRGEINPEFSIEFRPFPHETGADIFYYEMKNNAQEI